MTVEELVIKETIVAVDKLERMVAQLRDITRVLDRNPRPFTRGNLAHLVDQANQQLQILAGNAMFLETDQDSVPEQIR